MPKLRPPAPVAPRTRPRSDAPWNRRNCAADRVASEPGVAGVLAVRCAAASGNSSYSGAARGPQLGEPYRGRGDGRRSPSKNSAHPRLLRRWFAGRGRVEGADAGPVELVEVASAGEVEGPSISASCDFLIASTRFVSPGLCR